MRFKVETYSCVKKLCGVLDSIPGRIPDSAGGGKGVKFFVPHREKLFLKLFNKIKGFDLSQNGEGHAPLTVVWDISQER